ncbi:MAG: PH domain-containing protein [Alphaproteobacteria bacterium]|nr:PH domain-containing protein [Alphaproteobacteria bacterium]
MGRYIEKNMQGGEKVCFSADLHWIVYHFGTTITVIGALLGHYGHVLTRKYLSGDIAGYLDVPIRYGALAIIFIGALYLIFAFVRQISTELVITNQRVIAKHGLISVTTYELMLPKVEGANIEQSITGRILGYGTVMVKGTGGGISPIDHVAKPHMFHAALMQALECMHGRPPSSGPQAQWTSRGSQALIEAD